MEDLDGSLGMDLSKLWGCHVTTSVTRGWRIVCWCNETRPTLCDYHLTSTGFIVYWWEPTCHQTKSIKFGYTREIEHFQYKSCSILETVVTGTFSDWTGKGFTSKIESKATIERRDILVRYDRTVCGPTSCLLPLSLLTSSSFLSCSAPFCTHSLLLVLYSCRHGSDYVTSCTSLLPSLPTYLVIFLV